MTINKIDLDKLKKDFDEIDDLVDNIYASLNVNHLNYVSIAKKNAIRLKNKIEDMKKEYHTI